MTETNHAVVPGLALVEWIETNYGSGRHHMKLVEFLLSRIAEDEAWAMTSASTSTPGSFARDNYGALLIQPARVVAECEAKRRMIADLTSERHEVVEDCWYTCAAATEEHDGGNCCDDGRGEDCDCGLDNRVARRLGLLALPYAGHADFHPTWRV